MTRLQEYNAFVAGSPSDAALLAQVKASRDVADRALLLARLRYSYVDYHPFAIARRLADGDSAGDATDTRGSVTLRSGWVRWGELRTRIDAVDAWIGQPDMARGRAVLREIMVDVPDTIDDQSDYVGKLGKVTTEAAKEVIDTSAGVLIPVAVIATVIYLSSRR